MPTTNTNNNPAQTPYTAAELDERTKYRRAVEAVIWGMPLVNTEAMRQAYLRDVGATYNDICYFSRPADWRFQVTTPNASTNYVYFNVNLTQGPVVIEVPEPVGAGLLGGMLDAWDVTIAGVGPADENNGKAAKYLLLPPGFDGEIPDGYIVVRFATYNGYALLRAIPATKSEADVAAALTLVKKIRAYPLEQAENPPQQRFIDIHGKTFNGITTFDERFFESLNRMVQDEPVAERDLLAMAAIKSIGIEKGKEFTPDDAAIGLLRDAAQEQLAVFVEGMKTFGEKWWTDRTWKLPDARGVKTNFSYIMGDYLDVDARGLSNFAAFGFPKRVGQGGSIVYLVTFLDDNGEPIAGERSYRLHVPPSVPAKQYWSVIAYDAVTYGFIRESPVVGLDSYNQAVQRNTDGSVDLYFGPEAAAGTKSNWIYTAPGRRWFPGFRLYDPDTPFFDKRWVLPDLEELK
jgi:hypothetical protein